VGDPGENEGWQGNIRPGINDVVEACKYIGCPFRFSFGSIYVGVAGKEDLSLDVREGLGDDGDRCRFLVFARDGCKWLLLLLLLLAYAGIEAFGPGEIFGRVSPDV
jgi:hypothetical protein